MSFAPPDVGALARGVLTRDLGQVSRAISLVEDRRASAEPHILGLLAELSRVGGSPRAERVGVTGPPGVGKSSLVSALLGLLRQKGRSVAVLAVDPSSPRSGGALLGDRARMVVDPGDRDVFVRSMASGGQLGGLARAAGAALDVLSHAYDVVLVETTGVGQSETDVEHVTDTVVLVIQPASGDMLQFIKAGILEIPDVLAVNKADLGAVAERAVADLTSALSAVSRGRGQDWLPPVIATSTVTMTGLDALWAAVERHRAHVEPELDARRRDKATRWALRLYTQRFGDAGVDAAGGQRAVLGALRAHVDGGASAVEAVHRVAARRD